MHVGLDELASVLQRPVNVCFSGEMDDDLRCSYEWRGYSSVSDVTLDEAVTCVTVEVFQVLKSTGVRQLVECCHMPVVMGLERVADEIAPDKACAAGDQNALQRGVLQREFGVKNN